MLVPCVDPSVNAAVGWEYCRDKKRMIEAAQILCRLPERVLLTIQHALEAPSMESRQLAVTTVLQALRDVRERTLAMDTLVAHCWIRRNFGLIHDRESERIRKFGNTPNVAAYIELLTNLETISSLVGFDVSHVVHDETSSMEEVLRFFQTRASDEEFIRRAEHFLPNSRPVLSAVPRTVFSRTMSR